MDYPSDALKLGQEGVTRVVLSIDRKGRVAGCRIVETSGSASLDAATCPMMEKLRYHPARDANGAATTSEVPQKMRWQIPRPVDPPPAGP